MVEKQAKFLRTICIFVQKGTEMGFLLTGSEFERPPALAELYAKQKKGIQKSLHISRLAFDINAYKDGVWLNGREKWHIPLLTQLGVLWESLDPLCRWGGRFTNPVDYNHYSFEHNGVK